jgi:hypothetical protein
VIAFGWLYHTNQTIEKIQEALNDPFLVEKMAKRNYELGRRFYSYSVFRTGIANFNNRVFW